MPAHHSGSHLRRLRLESGLGLRTVAEQLKVSPQAIHQLEKSEAAGTISLYQLENVARVMGHRLVYTLEPANTQKSPRKATAAPPEAQPHSSTSPDPVPKPAEPAKFLDNWMEGRLD